jgi:hypothetical protein
MLVRAASPAESNWGAAARVAYCMRFQSRRGARTWHGCAAGTEPAIPGERDARAAAIAPGVDVRMPGRPSSSCDDAADRIHGRPPLDQYADWPPEQVREDRERLQGAGAASSSAAPAKPMGIALKE